MTISASQLRALQTLWSRFARHAQVDANDRATRLAWVSAAIGREVGSFSELGASEAAQLIDRWKGDLGQQISRVPRRPGRKLALAYGTAGKRGRADKEILLVDHETRRVLDALMEKLGWSREQLDAFLRSSRSPVKSGAIRTLAEANRVIWALRAIDRRRKTSPQDQNAAELRRAG